MAEEQSTDIFGALPIKDAADDPIDVKLPPTFKRSIYKIYRIKTKNGFGQDENGKNVIAAHCLLRPRLCCCLHDQGIKTCEIRKLNLREDSHVKLY